MNFNVYVRDQLGKELELFCQTTRKSLSAVISEALENYFETLEFQRWPPEFLAFHAEDNEGILPDNYREASAV